MKLFSPIKIGTLEVKNRIVMPPMVTHFAHENGRTSERMIRYYEERAKGGAGLIIVEATGVARCGKCLPIQHMMDNDAWIPDLKRLADAIKRHRARAGIQLMHGGVKASAKYSQMQPVGPSLWPDYPAEMGVAPRALTVEEIHDQVEAFGEAAGRAKEAGFDVIELHFAHSYLVDQFLSPRFNHRKDMYGGSKENRARLGCEVIESVRRYVGEDYPIGCRISGEEGVAGGIMLDDAQEHAKLMVNAGANYIHVTVGISENSVSTPPMSFPYGCFLHLSEGIKKAVDVPVIGVGKINMPEFAEEVLREGRADLVAMGRALIADPHLPSKAREGRSKDIVPCIYCNQGCITRMFNGLDISCLVNPAVGKEAEFEMESTSDPQKILVVGGGPGGLKGAIVAKQRGHDVILAEKKDQLGGQLRYACKPPGKKVIENLVDYFSEQVKKMGISTHLGKEVTGEFIKEVRPDIIIMATGATSIMPNIPGIEGDNVFLATEMLTGKKPLGKKSIIVGGGQTGLETADFLAEAGQEVTIIEMLSEVGMDMPLRNKMFLMKKLSTKHINILVNREITEITDSGVRTVYSGQQEDITGDTVIVSVGSEPEKDLLREIAEMIPALKGLYMLGDCIEPRTALEAISEAARIAKEV